MEHLSNDHGESPNQHEFCHNRIVKNYTMKQGIPFWVWQKSMETEATTWLEFSNWGKAIVEQIPASEDRNKSKRVGLRVTVRDLSRKINHLSKIIWEKKIIRKFTRSIISTRLAQPVLIVDVEVSKDKHISRWVDWENLIFSC